MAASPRRLSWLRGTDEHVSAASTMTTEGRRHVPVHARRTRADGDNNDPGDDPITQLLGPPAQVGRLRPRHWVGIAILAGVLGIAALAVPWLISQPEHPVAGPATSPSSHDLPRSAGATPSSITSTPTSQPTPSSTPTRPTQTATRAFTPIIIEAEDHNNLLTNGAQVIACATCDAGARVRYIYGANHLIVRTSIPVAGQRTITITYELDGERQVYIALNDSPPIVRDTTGTSWEIPRSFQFTAALDAGPLELTFSNDNLAAPDIDRVTIS